MISSSPSAAAVSPVVETEDGLRGVAAVIDKDRASSLLAQDVRADRLIILTAVDAVCVNYNKPDQKELSSMTIAECEKYIAEGQFAPEACCRRSSPAWSS